MDLLAVAEIPARAGAAGIADVLPRHAACHPHPGTSGPVVGTGPGYDAAGAAATARRCCAKLLRELTSETIDALLDVAGPQH